MRSIELVGYAAAFLVIVSFYMKTMIPLRYVAIAGNVTYIFYGYTLGLHPMVLLHTVLVPLNIARLVQMKKLIRAVDEASRGDLSMDWLMPFTTRKNFRKGDVIARKGEVTDNVYFVLKGRVWLEELHVFVEEGNIIGEIGVFAPGSERSSTMIAHTDLETLTVSSGKIKELYFQNPRLGLYLTQLIVKRLLQNQQHCPQQ
jgi:CRP/FNR family transcriptional regulator, cyclic AMP receptor protein